MVEGAQYGRLPVNARRPPSDSIRIAQKSQHDALTDRLSEGVQGRVDCNPDLPSANAKTQRVPPQPRVPHKGRPTRRVSVDEPGTNSLTDQHAMHLRMQTESRFINDSEGQKAHRLVETRRRLG